jgi:hypothetical protein
MNGEARKPHLIEVILKTEDEALLKEVENVLTKGVVKTPERKNFADFTGILTDEEADEWLKNIDQGCEQIHPDDWK